MITQHSEKNLANIANKLGAAWAKLPLSVRLLLPFVGISLSAAIGVSILTKVAPSLF